MHIAARAAASAFWNGRCVEPAVARFSTVFRGNDNGVMLCSPLQNCVGWDLVVQHHGCLTLRFVLWADNCAAAQLTSCFQQLKQNLQLALICNGVEQRVIQNQQIQIAVALYLALKFREIGAFQCRHLFQEPLTVAIPYVVRSAGGNAKCFCQIWPSAVRWIEDANIQALGNTVKRHKNFRNTIG